MQFDLPKEKSSIIKVIGVGGGGGNAVNHMFRKGIKGVNFIVANTDEQAMELSPVTNRVQLGPALTEGRGAGSMPETGRKAAEESMEAIREVLGANTKMLFVTAGMGGGTGTGGAPVVARVAREMGILTVGIVTMPFTTEGRRKIRQATEGVQEMKKHVDALIIISNDKISEMFGNLPISAAFGHADDVLATAAKAIAEIITVPGHVNVDFEDVRTVMTGSGVAIMGSAMASGEHRAIRAVQAALASPLLNDNDIRGARHILLNITSGTEEVLMDEIQEIMTFVQERAGDGTDIIWGNCYDESIAENLSVTLIATGFETDQQSRKAPSPEVTKVVMPLDEKPATATSHPAVERPPVELKTDEARTQITFDFEVNQQPKQKPVPVSDEAKRRTVVPPKRPAERSSDDSAERQRQERIKKLRKLSMQLNNPSQLEEVENTPAYKRTEVELKDVPASDESELSRYSVHEDPDGNGAEVRKDNSFLHGNVD